MPSVIEFESGVPVQKLAQNAAGKFDYGQVEDALVHGGYEIAENVYARCAKHHLRKLLGEVGLAEGTPADSGPFWVAGLSVTLAFDGRLDTSKLEDLTEALGATLHKLHEERGTRLVGPLNTQVMQVGARLLKFSLQQKWWWGRDHHG